MNILMEYRNCVIIENWITIRGGKSIFIIESIIKRFNIYICIYYGVKEGGTYDKYKCIIFKVCSVSEEKFVMINGDSLILLSI